MSLSKMRHVIDIITTIPQKDNEGFSVKSDTVLATIRASREDHQGTEKSTNMAAFLVNTAVFKFRRIPKLRIDTTHFLVCDGIRYNIISVKDVRGMYVEVVCERQEGSVK